MNGSFNGKRLFNDRLSHKSWICEKKEKLNAPFHSINKWGDQDKSAIFSSPITQKPRMIIKLHKVQKLLIIDFWWGLGWGGVGWGGVGWGGVGWWSYICVFLVINCKVIYQFRSCDKIIFFWKSILRPSIWFHCIRSAMEQKWPEAEPYRAFSGTKHLRLFLLPP